MVTGWSPDGSYALCRSATWEDWDDLDEGFGMPFSEEDDGATEGLVNPGQVLDLYTHK